MDRCRERVGWLGNWAVVASFLFRERGLKWRLRRGRGFGTPRQKATDLLNLIEQGVPPEEALKNI